MRQIVLPHPHRPSFHITHRAVLVLVVGGVLAAAVLVAALADGPGTEPIAGPSAVPAVEVPATADGVRYDGGPEEGAALQPSASIGTARYDGGPEEGSALQPSAGLGVARYDGGPEEGSRGSISGR